ncbi:transcription antitermination factor NusB [Marinobacterium sp. D7]|uniref:transcription antitermination factor NusB n=1 Tax=Marinobacterium ramblicola TaxID=2849041 RepID=UPI001C2DCAE6|nr:transcription antitermination factor NusB [Marinobacterium ramblicola]MBV1787437.1 transcription antitermination factor NusB [Marinobacterium ramblicola]
MSDTPSQNQAEPKKNRKPSLTEQRRSARQMALQALYQWQVAGQPVNEIEAQFRVNNDMNGVDVKLFSQLLRGVVEARSELDLCFSPFLDRTIDELDPVEVSVLRIGSFELMHRMEVPYRVAINESVELAKVFGATESHRYVNGVLDKVAQKVRAAEVSARR